MEENNIDYRCQGCNIILITADALRADHLGCYGYSKNTSPFIDSFAENSWLFTNSISQAGSTINSVPSLFTSKFPGEFSLETTRTLAEILKNSGYNTAAIVSHVYVKHEFMPSQGFDYYDDNFYIIRDIDEMSIRNASETSGLTISWLKKNSKNPFFLWLHYREPHMPYDPPEYIFEEFYKKENGELTFYDAKEICVGCVTTYKMMHDRIKTDNVQKYVLFGRERNLSNRELNQLRALYDGNIRYLDTNLERLFEYLNSSGLIENTLILLTADHGESLGEHNIFDHNELYYGILHVPLILKHPKLKKNIVDKPVSSVDIFPTILSILDIWFDKTTIRGKNLFLKENEFQFAQYSSDHYTIIKEDWKLLHKDGTDFLFNIRFDPNESFDLKEENKLVLDNLKTWALRIIAEQIKLVDSEPVSNRTVDKELKEELESLGYLI